MLLKYIPSTALSMLTPPSSYLFSNSKSAQTHLSQAHNKSEGIDTGIGINARKDDHTKKLGNPSPSSQRQFRSSKKFNKQILMLEECQNFSDVLYYINTVGKLDQQSQKIVKKIHQFKFFKQKRQNYATMIRTLQNINLETCPLQTFVQICDLSSNFQSIPSFQKKLRPSISRRISHLIGYEHSAQTGPSASSKSTSQFSQPQSQITDIQLISLLNACHVFSFSNLSGKIVHMLKNRIQVAPVQTQIRFLSVVGNKKFPNYQLKETIKATIKRLHGLFQEGNNQKFGLNQQSNLYIIMIKMDDTFYGCKNFVGKLEENFKKFAHQLTERQVKKILFYPQKTKKMSDLIFSLMMQNISKQGDIQINQQSFQRVLKLYCRNQKITLRNKNEQQIKLKKYFFKNLLNYRFTTFMLTKIFISLDVFKEFIRQIQKLQPVIRDRYFKNNFFIYRFTNYKISKSDHHLVALLQQYIDHSVNMGVLSAKGGKIQYNYSFMIFGLALKKYIQIFRGNNGLQILDKKYLDYKESYIKILQQTPFSLTKNQNIQIFQKQVATKFQKYHEQIIQNTIINFLQSDYNRNYNRNSNYNVNRNQKSEPKKQSEQQSQIQSGDEQKSGGQSSVAKKKSIPLSILSAIIFTNNVKLLRRIFKNSSNRNRNRNSNSSHGSDNQFYISKTNIDIFLSSIRKQPEKYVGCLEAFNFMLKVFLTQLQSQKYFNFWQLNQQIGGYLLDRQVHNSIKNYEIQSFYQTIQLCLDLQIFRLHQYNLVLSHLTNQNNKLLIDNSEFGKLIKKMQYLVISQIKSQSQTKEGTQNQTKAQTETPTQTQTQTQTQTKTKTKKQKKLYNFSIFQFIKLNEILIKQNLMISQYAHLILVERKNRNQTQNNAENRSQNKEQYLYQKYAEIVLSERSNLYKNHQASHFSLSDQSFSKPNIKNTLLLLLRSGNLPSSSAFSPRLQEKKTEIMSFIKNAKSFQLQALINNFFAREQSPIQNLILAEILNKYCLSFNRDYVQMPVSCLRVLKNKWRFMNIGRYNEKLVKQGKQHQQTNEENASLSKQFFNFMTCFINFMSQNVGKYTLQTHNFVFGSCLHMNIPLSKYIDKFLSNLERRLFYYKKKQLEKFLSTLLASSQISQTNIQGFIMENFNNKIQLSKAGLIPFLHLGNLKNSRYANWLAGLIKMKKIWVKNDVCQYLIKKNPIFQGIPKIQSKSNLHNKPLFKIIKIFCDQNNISYTLHEGKDLMQIGNNYLAFTDFNYNIGLALKLKQFYSTIYNIKITQKSNEQQAKQSQQPQTQKTPQQQDIDIFIVFQYRNYEDFQNIISGVTKRINQLKDLKAKYKNLMKLYRMYENDNRNRFRHAQKLNSQEGQNQEKQEKQKQEKQKQEK